MLNVLDSEIFWMIASIQSIYLPDCTIQLYEKEGSDNSPSLGQTEFFEWHTHFKTGQLLYQDVFSGGQRSEKC